MLGKLKQMAKRYDEIERLMQDPAVTADPAKMGILMREYGQLQKSVLLYKEYEGILRQKEEARRIINTEEDEGLRKLAEEDLARCAGEETQLAEQLQSLLLDDPSDAGRGIIMEIRPGPGGQEAALFAADLMRMYLKFIERKGWKAELIDLNETDLKGVKSATLSVRGEGAYPALRFEGGTHRVQRVPSTEASGRIHTSTATVVVLPEAREIEVQLKPEEVLVETSRAGGPGGQHVNKTESAIRMVHLPTGIEVRCRTDRSQRRNRELAEILLKARVLEHFAGERRKEQSSLREAQVRTGDRSEKIRTYNFAQNRVTDHRVDWTSHRLAEILDGDLEELTQKLMASEKQRRLQALRREAP